MSKKIEKPNKETIVERYSKYGSSLSSVARSFGVSNPTLRSWMKFYGIERKGHKQSCTEVNSMRRKDAPTKENLERLYQTNSIKSLEKIFGVGQETVYGWLDEYGIEIKDHKQACADAKTRQFSHINYNFDTVKSVYEKYKNCRICADVLGISVSHFRKLKNKYGIETEIPWRSSAEIELFEYCKSLDTDFVANDKSIINPYEIDIIHHKHKLAIEYCGLYWHSEYYGKKDKSYHKKKRELCEKKGYDLITVFESDDLELVKCLIRSKLGLNERIYARKTKIKKIDSKTANEFHTKHHLHGSVGSRHNYGLFYEDELVMVSSFGKSRYSQKYDYECTRMTSHSDYSVIGGASKLFKTFMREESCSSLITYADYRFGSGKVYNHCNMVRTHNSDPNYWYFNKNNPCRLYSRVKFQKHKQKDMFDNFDESLTEYQNALNNGWDRIYDCGNAVFSIINT